MNWKVGFGNVVLLAVFPMMLIESVAFAKVSEEELKKIKDAVPAKATVEPAKPRKLLVFNRCDGFKHSSIPYWDKALEIMGKKTGAFSIVISNDMEVFRPESLKQFDAVCLNNTTQLKFEEPLRKSLMDFVKGGKGIVGIHAATDNFYDWPEAMEMMGGKFTGHPWTADGQADQGEALDQIKPDLVGLHGIKPAFGGWAIKIDEPNHPLTAMFEGKGFKIKDEIYRTEPPLYSRDKQLVLMSLDMSDEATRKKAEKPTDADTGITWIKMWGQGRVFYCALGHNHDVAWNPAVLKHYLDGIQFAFGDLKVDTKPRPIVGAGKGS